MGIYHTEQADLIHIPDLLYYLVIVLSAFALVISLSNLKFLHSLRTSFPRIDPGFNGDSISVLVPARNEEDSIAYCLSALIAQTYPKMEILILNDRSLDDTATIIESYADLDPRIRMIQGSTLPEGWSGKNWACEQLFRESKGDLVLFIDADTILSLDTISASIYESNKNEADLLTVMPKRIANCITERLMFPFMDWFLFSWMPMIAAKTKRGSYLSASFGQFMLFRREAYSRIGGHASLKNNPLDDFSLGRITKKIGLKWVLYEGTSCVEVMSYNGNIQAIRGISRSIFPALNFSITTLILFSAVLLSLGLLPIINLTSGLMDNAINQNFMALSLYSLVMLTASWAISCFRFKHSYLIALFHPISMAVILVVGYHSMITYIFQMTHWKDRTMPRQRIRF